VELLDRPLIQAALMIVAILLGVGVVVLRGSRKVKREGLPGIAGLLARGEYEQAGNLAVRYGRLDDAIEYYLRAQQPVRAAHVAVKMSDARRAAELFERAGEHERAAFYYDQADMGSKASAPQEKDVDRSAEDKAEDEPVQAARSESKQAEKRESEADQEMEEGPYGLLRHPQTPSKLAPFDTSAGENATEADAAEARTGAAVEPEDDHKPDASAEAADALFRSGDIRGAADAYRDAGLYEEAINLYVNLLGLPAEAASLLEKTGNLERAAELRALAKQPPQSKSVPVESAPPEAPSSKEEEPLAFGEPVGTPASSPPSSASDAPAGSPAQPPAGWQIPSSARHQSDQETMSRTSDPPPPVARPSDQTLGFGEKARNLVAQARAAYEASPVARRRKKKQQPGEDEPPPTGRGKQEAEPAKDERPSPADRKGRSWSPPLSRTKQ
jgi:tetratricopeptide (TPR) repeat protein